MEYQQFSIFIFSFSQRCRQKQRRTQKKTVGIVDDVQLFIYLYEWFFFIDHIILQRDCHLLSTLSASGTLVET